MRKENIGQTPSNEVLCAEYEALYQYVLSLCHDATKAQDITQETFLKAMRNAKNFKGDSSLYTWLCAIAKHLWFNHYSKRVRELYPGQLPEKGQNEANFIEQHVVEQDITLYIHRILHTLKEPYKEVFSLRVFGQLSFANIASLFSKTESWARVTYHRAKKMLIEEMKKDDYYEG